MIREVIPLCQLYYKHATSFYENWLNRLSETHQSIKGEGNRDANYPSNWINEIFEDRKGAYSLSQFLKILDWLLFNIKTEEIYEFHATFILKITDQYHSILKTVVDFYEPNSHNGHNGQFAVFTQKTKKLISNFKVLLRRSS